MNYSTHSNKSYTRIQNRFFQPNDTSGGGGSLSGPITTKNVMLRLFLDVQYYQAHACRHTVGASE